MTTGSGRALTAVEAVRGAYAAPDDHQRVATVLLDRLARRADRAGLLDLACRRVDSPVGALLLVASEQGLIRVAFAVEGHDDVLQVLAHEVSPRILPVPRRLDPAARQLDQYFGRRRRRFDLPLDLRLAHGFRAAVLAYLRTIPYGETVSYAGAAAGAGRPAAVRAAATACARNPLPLVVPCHRVVRSDGADGGYLAGPAVKRALLDLEAGE